MRWKANWQLELLAMAGRPSVLLHGQLHETSVQAERLPYLPEDQVSVMIE
jgi:hypothetical protein